MRTGVFKDPATGAPVALSKLGLGCSKVGSFNNPAPMSQIRGVMERALDLGVTVFDTADIYGQGDSEREIGRAIRGRREQAFVVTKFGKLFSAKMRLVAPFKPVLKPLVQAVKAGAQVAAQRDGAMAEDFSPGRYAAALDASLRRLGLDHVDGVLMHSPST
jgi:aryl-alcohol dehydrogenase-like predicted oxidoreductase